MLYGLILCVSGNSSLFAGLGGAIGHFSLSYKKNNADKKDEQNFDKVYLKNQALQKIKGISATDIQIVQESLNYLNNMGFSDSRDVNEIIGFILNDTPGFAVNNDFLATTKIDNINKALFAAGYLGADATTVHTLLSYNVPFDPTSNTVAPSPTTPTARPINELVIGAWNNYLSSPGKAAEKTRFEQFQAKFKPIFDALNGTNAVIQKQNFTLPLSWPAFVVSGNNQTTNSLGVFLGHAIDRFEYSYNPRNSEITFIINDPTDALKYDKFQSVTSVDNLVFSIDKIADALATRRDLDQLKIKLVVVASNDGGFAPTPEEIRAKLLEKWQASSAFDNALQNIKVQQQASLLQDQDVRSTTTVGGGEMFAGYQYMPNNKYFMHARMGMGYFVGDVKGTEDKGSKNIQGRLGHFGYVDVGVHRWLNDLIAFGMVAGVQFNKLRLQQKAQPTQYAEQYLWSPTLGLEMTTRPNAESKWFVKLHSGWQFGMGQKWHSKETVVDVNDTVTLQGLVTGIRFGRMF